MFTARFRSLVLISVLTCAMAACAKKPAPVAETAADLNDTSPLETRERNAVDYQPAFEGQTRAPGIRNGTRPVVTTVAEGLVMPWSVEPLADGRFLVAEHPGNLRFVTAEGKISAPVSGLPQVLYSGQAGLLDLALDPDFTSNHVIYWCYSEERSGGSGTTLARGVLVEAPEGARLDQVKILFRQLPTFESVRQVGSRIAFSADGKLYLALGERGLPIRESQVQNLGSHFGKIVRLNRDGSVPKDNPFVGRADALPEIWSYGHRNIQAAAVDSVTGRFWTIEHGPRGGDELNHPESGRNYGWPVITYGIDYPGDKISTGSTAQEGMEQPVYYWDPVIAPSGMTVYHGAMFPEWDGSIFVGGLMGLKLVRLKMEGEKVVGEEWFLQDVSKRIRDVQQGPDGSLYVITEAGDNSQLLRLHKAG